MSDCVDSFVRHEIYEGNAGNIFSLNVGNHEISLHNSGVEFTVHFDRIKNEVYRLPFFRCIIREPNCVALYKYRIIRYVNCIEICIVSN